MRDVDVVHTSGGAEYFKLVTSGSIDTHEEAVDGVIDNRVMVNIRADAAIIRGERDPLETRFQEVRFLETVRVGRDCRLGAVVNAVECQCRPGVNKVQRADHLRDTLDKHAAATIGNLSMVDIAQEDTSVGMEKAIRSIFVDVITELDATPVTSQRGRGNQVRITIRPDRGVMQRGKVNATGNRITGGVADKVSGSVHDARCSEHLESTSAAVNRGRRTADTDSCAT